MEISQKTVIIHSVCVNFQQFYVLSKHFLSLKRRWPLFRSTQRAFTLLALLPMACPAQFLAFYQSTRAMALAGAETCLTGNQGACANPAAGITGQTHSLAVACTLPFCIKDLAVKSLSWHNSHSHHALLLSLSHTGFPAYQEGLCNLTASRQVSSRFHIGLALRYSWLWINHYGSLTAVFLDAGLLHYISPRFRWGAACKNLMQKQRADRQENAPPIVQIGICWTPHEVAALHLDGYQESPYHLRLRLGWEIECWRVLTLRWGWATEPSNLGFGLAVRQKNWRLEYGCLDHADLGLTHSTAFTLFW